jgi:hypothetical protein
MNRQLAAIMSLPSRIASLTLNKPRTRAQVGAFPNDELKEVKARTKSTGARGAVEEAQSQPDVFSLEEALDREKNLIKDTRERLKLEPAKGDLSAICLSGGGIRSAVFCLGGLMALDQAKLIQQFDYLSTVSGGGYIGGWLSKLLKVLGDESVTASTSVFEAVRKKEEGMGAFKPASDAKTSDRSNFEPAALQFLRENSSYLTPQKSAFSGDTWSLAATYLRNLFLNWAILLPFAAAVLATPLWILGGLGSLQDPALVAHFTLLLALLALVYPTFVPALNDVVQDKGQRERSADRTDQERNARMMSLPSFLTLRLAPLAGALFLFTHWVFIETHQDSQVSHELSSGDIRSLNWIVGLGSGAPVVLLVLIAMVVSIRQHGALGRIPSHLTFFTQTLGAVCTVPSCAFLVPFLPGSGLWFYVWFPALATCTFLTAVALFAGLVDPLVQDENREWWARSAGYFLLFSTGWLILGSVCVGLPYAPMGFVKFDPAACPGGVCISVDNISFFSAPGGLGFLVVLGTGIVAYLTRLEGQITLAARWFGISLGQVRKLVFAIAITIFSVAFAIVSILLALRLAYFLNLLFVARGHHASEPSPEVAWWWLLIAVVLMGVVSVLISFPVNINRFSAHIAYRNRLVRTFLGASHLGRTYNPFTGFSQADNVPLYLLMEKQLDKDKIIEAAKGKRKPTLTSTPSQRPFHVICAAANVAQGDRLAWQERKAVSFTFSGLHCGGKEFGYQCSTEFGGPRGITLGTAMAVSGAAANSGMGFYSSPVKSFLLTLLNARLGWWFGNPMYKSTCSRESPRFALGPLLIELFSLSRRNAAWLNVSDGGHFDNTGVYEMLQRRCCRILLLDAETSRKGIANAARRARVDFNADLTLEKTASEGCPVERYRITYRRADGEIECYGTLLRVFPATGEPSAWSSFENSHYKCINKTFPDDSLLNQFFTETLFESYRKLGFDTVRHLVGGKLDLGEADGMKEPTFLKIDKLFGVGKKGVESSAPSPHAASRAC